MGKKQKEVKPPIAPKCLLDRLGCKELCNTCLAECPELEGMVFKCDAAYFEFKSRFLTAHRFVQMGVPDKASAQDTLQAILQEMA